MGGESLDRAGRYICFSLEGRKFAIPLMLVKEVMGNLKPTPIPKAPDYFKGILNLRGQIISIIDLKMKMRIQGQKSEVQPTIIILNSDSKSLGVIVDSVDCVLSYDSKDISQSLVEENLPFDLESIVGVAKNESDLTLILDLNKALDLKEHSMMNTTIEKSKAA